MTNERPKGWRVAIFDPRIAHAISECSEITGEIVADFSKLGLVADEGSTWDFRPFGQSLAVRKHRVARSYIRTNAWKVDCGMRPRREVKKAAKKFADRAVADSATAGCKCAVRMGSRTWLAVL